MKEVRVRSMQAYIAKHKTASIDTLCDVFRVSRNTIHRDLNILAKRGVVKKIYGGVVYEQSMDTVPFEDRSIKNQSQKQKIASIAVSLVQAGDSIFIDTGSTATYFYQALAKNQNLTIFTNNIDVLAQAISDSKDTVIFLGGSLSRKTHSVTGQDAVNTLSHYNIGKAFMSATGLSEAYGATNSTQEEYQVKKAAVESAREVVMMVDAGKFGVVSLMTFCTLSDIDTVVTDQLPPEQMADCFRSYQIEVIVAHEP